jgi:catechol 2,3-dioxygenase
MKNHTTNDPEWGIPAPTSLPAETRLGAVRLQVADLGRSVRYYTSVIGMSVLEEATGSVRLGAAGATAALLELWERRGARPVPPRGRLGLFHFAILVPDRASLGRFLRHLGDLGVAAGSADHLVSEALYLRDPDGLGIEMYCDRPRSAWQSEGRELAMATVPLDAGGVLEAGGEVSWTGLPSRTVMGHVHLHVGDLAEASAFYHAAIGFDKTNWSYPGALFLSAGGYHHHLGVNTWAPPTPQTDDDARLLEWTLVLPATEDVSAVVRGLRAAGYETEQEGARAAATDPWGTALRFEAAA